MDCHDWTQAIAARYFRREMAGRPVYLQIDDDELEDVGRDHGLERGNYDFIAALALATDPTGPAFVEFEHGARRWEERSDPLEPPPFIALLAGCVLAASRMAADPVAGIASHNYYARLREVLGRREQLSESDISFIVSCWNRLNQWLIADARGQFGQPTAQPRGHFSRIGYALSQCIIRAEDRNRLADFFLWRGLTPHSVVTAGEIKAEFFEWLGLSRCSLTPAGRERLRRSTPEVQELVADIVAREALDWDGSTRDSVVTGGTASPGRTAPIFLQAIEAIPRRALEIRFVGLRPDGFPEGQFTSDGDSITLRGGGRGVYDPLPLRISPQAIQAGFAIRQGRFTLRFHGSTVHVFTPDDQFGEWAARGQASLGVPQIVLAAPVSAAAALECIRRHAEPGFVTFSRIGGLPDGWIAFGDVRFNHMFAAPDGLEQLQPRRAIEVLLSGGLKFSPTCWAQFAPPTLQAYWEGRTRLPIEVDGTTLDHFSSPLELDLSTLDLSEGEHVVRIEGRERRFELRSQAPAGTRQERLIGRTYDQARSSVTNDTSIQEEMVPGLYGAVLVLPGQARPPYRMVGEFDVDFLAFLGVEPGRIVQASPRRLTGQLNAAQVALSLPQFPVAWYVERRRGHTNLFNVLRHPPDEPNILAIGTQTPERLRIWANTFRSARYVNRHCTDECRVKCEAAHGDYSAAADIVMQYLDATSVK